MTKEIEEFLKAEAFGVVGASSDRSKFGNRVLRCYQEHGLTAVPVNPKEKEIEGTPCVATVADLPGNVSSISIITPPQVTERVVEQAAAKGIRNVWMQPGAESPRAVAFCRENGINVIADGSCILVVLGYREH
ncbi:MAG TPA: CoA-binding protein [Geobacteraceae bacterium]|nr:CoA-binding protein [Geobacteraceae bacterium]